jgi:hypothetical protein
VVNKSDTFNEIDAPFDFTNMTIRDINEKIRRRLQYIHKNRYVFLVQLHILGGPKFNFGKYLENIEAQRKMTW